MSNEHERSLPESWIQTTLGDVLSILRGVSYIKTDAKNSPAQGLVPILRATNINEVLTFDDLVYVPEKYVDSEQFLQANDIVVAASSGSRKLVGKAAQLTNAWCGSFGTFCYALRPESHVNAKLLALFLQTSEYRHRISDLSAGVNINNLKQEHISGITYPLPPLAEQNRIVAEIEKHFTRLDAAVTGLKRIRANLKRYRASVLKAACEGRLVPTEAELAKAEGRDYEPADRLLSRILKERRAKWEADQLVKMKAQGKTPKDDKWKDKYEEPVALNTNDLSELPKGWRWTRAEQLCDFITKGTTPDKQKLFSQSGQIPFIKVYNLTHHGALDFKVNPTFINEETHSAELARSKVFPGDVLMNIVGPPLGKVSVVPDTYKEWNINQAIAVFRPMPGYNRKFLSFSLLADHILAWAERRAKATAGQFNLTLEICRDLPLPLPPFAEQQRIVAEVERHISIIEELESVVEANLSRAERLRQSILKRAFEGKLVPQDPNDEPASDLLERIRAEREKKLSEVKAQTNKRRAGKPRQPELDWQSDQEKSTSIKA